MERERGAEHRAPRTGRDPLRSSRQAEEALSSAGRLKNRPGASMRLLNARLRVPFEQNLSLFTTGFKNNFYQRFLYYAHIYITHSVTFTGVFFLYKFYFSVKILVY